MSASAIWHPLIGLADVGVAGAYSSGAQALRLGISLTRPRAGRGRAPHQPHVRQIAELTRWLRRFDQRLLEEPTLPCGVPIFLSAFPPCRATLIQITLIQINDQ